MNEAIARLEAKLRGGEAYCEVYTFTKQWRIKTATDDVLATDPATAEGREWWCEALKMDVVCFMDIDGNVMHWSAYPWLGDRTGRGKTRVEAMIDAIEAMAESEAAARPS